MRGFRSLSEYHNALKVQVVASILIGGHAMITNQLLGICLWAYSLFCAYLWLNYDLTIDCAELRRLQK